jgi:hypothetical protein
MIWVLITIILMAASFGAGVIVGTNLDKTEPREVKQPRPKIKRRTYIIFK